ncbi:MAG TPA: dTDP-4-dehydrorhamnose reductase [Patescibacteria group bacterium]|nr:dTDP-4-dehydrorhamnose reductase [Patescibacteria group bacterium]
MRIYILGANGMLGRALMKEFAAEEIMVGDLPEVDITKFDDLKKRLESFRPEIVINAAAYTDVDGSETNKEICNLVNGTAVGELSKICSGLNAVLVHYSTDYVFDGANELGYQENDQPAPINAYGQSKHLGEQLLQKRYRKYYLIRTAWLYGPEGKNFVNTIIEQSRQKSELKVVDDQFGNPTYTKDLAEATHRLLNSQTPFGIYHLTNSGSCSWHELAGEIKQLSGFDLEIKPVSSNEYQRPANRPKYSKLINTKLEQLRPWNEALREYLKTLK